MSKEKEEIDKLTKEKANELFEERLDFYMYKQGFDEGWNSALQEAIKIYHNFYYSHDKVSVKIIMNRLERLKK